ncbi:MAG: hypothetical protein JNL92_25300 [Opitutaceae bacterium]|nr:hypothetical protein [Opitutaceae bacterium]
MISAAKDLMTSKAAKGYLNDLIKTYGKVRDLTVDSKRGRIELTCELLGEAEPIGVTIERYVIVREAAGAFLEVEDSSASRPWLHAALRAHLHGRRIALPGWAASALG